VSEDEEWLKVNAPRLAAVLYFACERPMSSLSLPPNPGRPAEAFKFLVFEAHGADSAVRLWTKKGYHIEDNSSLRLHPPLAVRGSRSSPARTDQKDPACAALLRVFLEEPGHRIVTAVHHFFSAQFADSFTHPWESDCTSYCSCLEASLNIDPFAGKLHNRLYDRLSVMLGDESPAFRKWVDGLYAVRSVHAHGSAGAAVPGDRNDLELAYSDFRARRGTTTVVRAICRYAIVADLLRQRPTLVNPGLDAGASRKLLDMSLGSGERWQAVARALCGNGSVDTLCGMADSGDEKIIQPFLDVVYRFDWYFVLEQPAPAKVRRCIGVCARVGARILPDSAATFGDLCCAVEANDHDSIYRWSLRHAQQVQDVAGDTLSGTIFAVTVRLAAFFQAVSGSSDRRDCEGRQGSRARRPRGRTGTGHGPRPARVRRLTS
jgi:hypothetical protein